MVHLEFILFCLMRGDVEEAHQAAMRYGLLFNVGAYRNRNALLN